MPIRIQRKRTGGWRMPENTIYVGRPTEFGNPFPVEYMGREWSIELYERLLNGGNIGDAAAFCYKYSEQVTGDPNGLHRSHNHKYIQQKLRGKNLACWCKLNQACHADILLEIANSPTSPD